MYKVNVMWSTAEDILKKVPNKTVSVPIDFHFPWGPKHKKLTKTLQVHIVLLYLKNFHLSAIHYQNIIMSELCLITSWVICSIYIRMGGRKKTEARTVTGYLT